MKLHGVTALILGDAPLAGASPVPITRDVEATLESRTVTPSTIKLFGTSLDVPKTTTFEMPHVGSTHPRDESRTAGDLVLFMPERSVRQRTALKLFGADIKQPIKLFGQDLTQPSLTKSASPSVRPSLDTVDTLNSGHDVMTPSTSAHEVNSDLALTAASQADMRKLIRDELSEYNLLDAEHQTRAQDKLQRLMRTATRPPNFLEEWNLRSKAQRRAQAAVRLYATSESTRNGRKLSDFNRRRQKAGLASLPSLQRKRRLNISGQRIRRQISGSTM